jgi:acetylornithine deacetylase/succinyl-diaminopimelate desuccinylase-like protein
MNKKSRETATIITPRLLDEMVLHFKELIRFDTTNPPGNESPAACYIADVLNRDGIENELIEPVPGRTSVIARLRGDGSARPLLLMSHLDVVCAEEGRWDHHPFSAHEEEGYIWGRGALDCKNTVALWMTALLALSRSNPPPEAGRDFPRGRR